MLSPTIDYHAFLLFWFLLNMVVAFEGINWQGLDWKMQQQQHYDEKLNQMEEQMREVEQERGRAFNDLRQIKRVAEETNVMVDQSLASKRSISEPRIIEQQMGANDRNNESSEKDALLDNIRNEMDSLRSSEDNAMALLSDYKRRIQELEAELDKRKESEANLFDTLVMQTKQLEQNKILLEESKLEIISLEEKIKALQVSASQIIKTPGESGSQSGIKNNLYAIFKKNRSLKL